MTTTRKNINIRPTSVVPLLTAFCLAAPLKAQEAHPLVAKDNIKSAGFGIMFEQRGKFRQNTCFTALETQRIQESPIPNVQPCSPRVRCHQKQYDTQECKQELAYQELERYKTTKLHSEASALGKNTTKLQSLGELKPADSLETLSPLKAQVAQVPTTPLPTQPPIIPQPVVPSTPPNLQPLPPPEQLLQPSTPNPSTTPEVPPTNIPGTITIERFEFKGNTAFKAKELAKVIERFAGHPITFAELLEARSAITQHYVDKGYVTSGAFIPPQTLDRGVVTIQIVEGSLEDIKVNGLRRLNSNYVRSRLALAARKPLNVPHLLEALRLLQLDPLIANLSAELSAGSQQGISLLTVTVKEANTLSAQIFANNDRPPSIGSFRRGAEIREADLLGLGDSISLAYGNTDGSNDYNLSYTLPINPRNGTLNFSYTNLPSRVIEPPFDILDIKASSRYYDLTYRQPISQTPSQEFALGVTLSRRESRTVFLEGLAFPSPGTDNKGRTIVNALRFFQDWTQRGAKEVIAARSQFSVGLGILDSTVNSSGPDSRFFNWRGQAQYVRLLAPDTLFLVRGDVQVSTRPLVPIEQYGLGGRETLRGYREDVLLTDNGTNLSAEVRVPILRIPKWKSLLQVAPFVDVGTVFNSGDSTPPTHHTLAGTGLGLQLQVGNNVTARLDYGIPLVPVKSTLRTLQEKGLYFSILFNPF